MNSNVKPLLWHPHKVQVASGDQSAFIGVAMALRVGDVECILMAQSKELLNLAMKNGIEADAEGLAVEIYQVTLIHSAKVGVVVEEAPVVVSRPPIDVSDL